MRVTKRSKAHLESKLNHDNPASCEPQILISKFVRNTTGAKAHPHLHGCAQSRPLDVRSFGAKGDGVSDISQALLSAWKAACNSPKPSTIVIPRGTFGLLQASLEGPCKAPIELQVQGTLKAPQNPNLIKDGEWVTIQYLDHFTLSGSGTFDGQGARAWAQNDCAKASDCSKLPNNFSFNFLNNSIISGITSLNSKLFHMNVLGCNNVTLSRLTITAPGTSLNTDGIHVGRSSGVNITDSTIGTGDDCVSLGDGSKQVSITNVVCGPGHGISIGSLGRYKNEEPVVGVFVRNCTLINTLTGVRVKSWPSATTGAATDVHFDDITMRNVTSPIVIDQEYCPNNQCTLGAPSRVKISKVSFNHIRGTSASALAVKLVCSKTFPCEGVEIGDIDLAYHGSLGNITTNCANVQPTFMGRQNPPICAKNNAAQSS
ncbi:exopolygalacturonase-like [Coffea eugenioides]|uniref:exopolygalacturonase-like n=1 Tax=Coffea eugenioides TaxID=49369 RepID=UPI000F5C451A|nr:exopolygalacturonase-like [Coffea arabica]XP_027183726.1 exopolygalacturonase-like [Coffea eugenioides]